MITRIPRSSFSANINNTAQTNEHQTLSELFYKELEDKFSGKLMIFIRMLITNPIKMITLQLKNFSRTSTKNAKTRLWRWFPAVLRGVALLPAVISG